MRVLNKGNRQAKAYSDDYAFFIQALIDLYEATLEVDWLEKARDLNGQMLDQFWDEKEGGFFFSGKRNEPLIAQSKSPYDNAIPSTNSIAVSNLLRLSYLTGEEPLRRKAEKILQLFHPFISEALIFGFPFLYLFFKLSYPFPDLF